MQPQWHQCHSCHPALHMESILLLLSPATSSKELKQDASSLHHVTGVRLLRFRHNQFTAVKGICCDTPSCAFNVTYQPAAKVSQTQSVQQSIRVFEAGGQASLNYEAQTTLHVIISLLVGTHMVCWVLPALPPSECRSG
jgi:hypothetical protein